MNIRKAYTATLVFPLALPPIHNIFVLVKIINGMELISIYLQHQQDNNRISIHPVLI